MFSFTASFPSLQLLQNHLLNTDWAHLPVGPLSPLSPGDPGYPGSPLGPTRLPVWVPITCCKTWNEQNTSPIVTEAHCCYTRKKKQGWVSLYNVKTIIIIILNVLFNYTYHSWWAWESTITFYTLKLSYRVKLTQKLMWPHAFLMLYA